MSPAQREVAEAAVGFVVALILGLTGMGGGTFTTPALVLLSGLPAAAAVGTSLAFTAVVRVFAAPFYFFTGTVHRRYLAWLLAGSVPALVAGTWVLDRAAAADGPWDMRVLAIIGALLVATAVLTLLPASARRWPFLRRRRWLVLLSLPIGFETGFTSAGSGAIGGIMLLNFSELSPKDVVGTDLMFGLLLTLVGAGLHWSGGTVSGGTFARLLAGGVPGILTGGLLSRRLPARRLRPLVGAVALVLGLLLVVRGLGL